MKRNFLLGFCAFGIISGITSAAYNSSILNASAAVAKKQTSYKTANLSYAGAGTEKRNYTQTTGMVIDSVDSEGIITVKEGETISYVTTKNAKLKLADGTKIDKITDEYKGREMVVTSPLEMPAIYPACYEAKEVVVLPKGTSAIKATVKSPLNNKSTSIKLSLEDKSKLIANIDSSTVVENEQGEKISLASIKKRNTVIIYYSGSMTLSDPAQIYAYKIVKASQP